MVQPVSNILHRLIRFFTAAISNGRTVCEKIRAVVQKLPLQPSMFQYIFREMMVYFLVAFCFFFFIFFVNQILLMAGKILEKHVPFSQVALLVLFSLPSVIATAAPFATLVGTLMCLGRMASDNEILSLRALGFSYTTILLPMVLAGFLISVFSFGVNDILLPAGTIQFNKLYRKILTSTPVLELESNTIKRNGDTIMVCGTIENRIMDRLIVIDKDADKNTRYIVSSGAEILPSKNASVAMTIDMDNANIITIDKKNSSTFDYINSDSTVYSLFLKDLGGNGTGKISPREMSSRDVFKEYMKIRKQYVENIAMYQRELFNLYADLENTIVDNPVDSALECETEIQRIQDKKTKPPSRHSYNTYKMEFNMKFSLPFGSLCFIFISFPVGVIIRKRGQSTALFSGIIFCFLYWAILILGQTMGYRVDYNGFLAMWVPNILVTVSGLIMTIKVFRK